jgi:uncharacterized protein (TIGR02231 family)
MLTALALVALSLAPPPTASRINAVTVYPDRAEVTREARTLVKAGVQEILIGPLPIEMDDASLRVTGRGPLGTGLVLGDVEVRHVDGVEMRGAELDAAEIKLSELNEAIAPLDDRSKRIERMRELLTALQSATTAQIARELAATDLKPQSWQGAYDFLKKNLDDLAAEQRQTTRQRAALVGQATVAARLVEALKARRTMAHKMIAISLQSDAECEAALGISYAQPGASWAPSYEATMDPATGEVTLGMFAWVRQTTGESWNDLRLTLATGAPSLGIDLPRLGSLAIGPAAEIEKLPIIGQNYQDILKMSPGLTDAVSRLSGSNLNAEMIEELEVITSGTSAEFSRADGGYANIVTKLALQSQTDTVMTFEVPGTVSLNPDGQPRRIAVSRTSLPGRRQYLVVPAVRPAAYLVARLTAPPDHPLLGGVVKHYVGSTLVGTSTLPSVAPGEEFTLSFGSDDRVKVESPALPQTTSGKGDSRTSVCTRRVSVTNRTGGPIDVEVRERMPVSTSDQIKVTPAGTITAGYDLKDGEPGIYTWKHSLDPDARQEVSLRYTVRYPSSMTLATMR